MYIDFKEAFAHQQPPSTEEMSEVKKRLTQEYDTLSKRVKMLFPLYWLTVSACWVSAFVFMHYGNTLLKTTMIIVTLLLGVLPIIRPFKTSTQRRKVRTALHNLTTMDASNMPNACTELDEWRKKDNTIDAYLSAINGRSPVIGEYLAAKEWRDGQIQQKKIARAKQACERFS